MRESLFGDSVMTKEKNKESSNVTASSPVSLEVYKALVDRCAKGRLNFPIANGSALHARILIEKLFEIARNDACLVTGSLRQTNRSGVDIYAHDRVISSAKKFLASKDSQLSVVVQTGKIDGGANNAFFKAVVNNPERQGIVRIYLPADGALSASDTPHFMISDGSAYRYETGKDASPANESISAIANFGDLRTAETLSDIFSDVVGLLRTDNNLRELKEFEPGASYVG